MLKPIYSLNSRAHHCGRLLLVLSFILTLVTPLAQASTDKQLAKILVLGDSISAAYGFDPSLGWVTLLSEQLPPGYAVINASVSGETSAGGLNRLPALLSEHQPSIVIIELGGNDGLRGYPIINLRKNLQTLINLSLDAGAQPLLLGMKIPPNYGKRYTEAFADSYKKIAKVNDLPWVDFFLDDIATNSSLMQSDGIHPNADAQALIVQKVLPALTPLLN
jgi:acyl-CoA thioesterase-1